MSKAAAKEFATKGIRVNSIQPGLIRNRRRPSRAAGRMGVR